MKSGREMSLWGKGCPENHLFIQTRSLLQTVPSAVPDPLQTVPSAVPDSQPQGEGSVLVAEGAEPQDVP